MSDLVTTTTAGLRPRLFMLAGLVIAVVLGLNGIRWQIGNMVANLTLPTDPSAAVAADLAVGLAPTDPVAHWLKGTANISLSDFERAVILAPSDYRWRIELGRALEQDGQIDKAEAQFRQAVALAPNYAFSHWGLANFLLRRGRPDEAMVELRRAADADRAYRDQAFSLVWEYFDRDVVRLEAFAGDTSEARARLAYFFAARGRAADALKNWNTLTDAEKAENPDILKAMAHGLFLQRHFGESLAFARQAGLDPEAQSEAVTDGSFEKGFGALPDSRFGWQIVRADTRVDVSADTKVKHDGNRSARMNFRNSIKPDFYNLTQTVAVVSNARYRLRFWVRTENLKSAATPLISIVNANDDKPVASSKPFDTGTVDWQEVVIEFTAPANCSGVNLRTVRLGCGEECPISGTLWYDDFRMERL